MGDRCYLNLRCRPQDVEAIEEQFGKANYSQAQIGGGVHLEFEEVNYGGDDELRRLCEMGIPFEGDHTAGGEYPACAFACADKELIAVCTEGSWPIVHVDSGEVSEPELAEVRRYEVLRRRVLAILSDTPQEETNAEG